MKQIKITTSITVKETASLEKYLSDISKEPLISTEKEIELAKRIKAGDSKALDELVKANLRFVVSVAKKYQNRGTSLIDLISEGNLGLMKAAKKFDETKGFKFISYAVWWIRQTIQESLDSTERIVRAPLNKVQLANQYIKMEAKLEQELQRQPTELEVLEAIDMESMSLDKKFKDDKVRKSHIHEEREIKKGNMMYKVLACNKRTTSLDEQISDDLDSEVRSAYLIDESAITDVYLMKDSIKKDVNELLKTFTYRESEIVKMFFGIDRKEFCTLEEIGEKLELSTERIRQIKEKVLLKMRGKILKGKRKNIIEHL